MPANSDWTSGLEAGIAAFSHTVLAYLPQLLAGIGLLLLGWLLAVLARAAVTRVTERLGRWLPRGGLRSLLSPALIGGVAFWAVIVCFLAIAGQTLGLTVFSLWLARVVGYLPVLLAAIVVLLVGLGLSQLAREATIKAAADLEHRALLGYAVQTAILVAVVVIGLDLLSLHITLLVVMAAILVGALAGGLALAFGLGAKVEVANLLATRALRQRIVIGDTIRVGDLQGQVVDVTDRAVVIATAECQVTIPGRQFSEQGYAAIVERDHDD